MAKGYRQLPKGFTNNEHREKYPGLKLGQIWDTCEGNYIFECQVHGDFNATPSNVVNSHRVGFNGCALCRNIGVGKRKKLTRDQVLKLYPNIKNPDDWKGNKTPQTFICPVHGDFVSYPSVITKAINTRAKGCGYCAGKRIKIEPLCTPEVVQPLLSLGVIPNHSFLVLGQIISLA